MWYTPPTQGALTGGSTGSVSRHAAYLEQAKTSQSDPHLSPEGSAARAARPPGRGSPRVPSGLVEELLAHVGTIPEVDAVAPRQTDGLVGEVPRGDDPRLVGVVVGLCGGHFLHSADTHLACTPVLGLDRGLGTVPFKEEVSPVVRSVRSEGDLAPRARKLACRSSSNSSPLM